MKVLQLTLPRYKNLIDFEIKFDGNVPDVLIVGNNGAGKSNLIEALVIIFRDLIEQRSSETDFAYTLVYEIRGVYVSVDHDPSRDRLRTTFLADSNSVNLSYISDNELLPKTVFAYYSGASDRLSRLFDRSLVDFRNQMIAGDISAHQSLIYGRPIHSRFVLLAFLIEQEAESLSVLREELGIEELDSALFVLQRPSWGANQPVADKAQFWKAKGVVKAFLDRLYHASLAPLQLVAKERTGINTKTGRQRIHLFIRRVEDLRRIVDSLRPPDEARSRSLFRLLESAFVSDLIHDVAVTIRKTNADGGIGFRELSEGEQQLLMVLGLLRFTRDEESLFLLDEPDTHLNPVWGLKFLDLVAKVVGQDRTRHLLLVTHDPVAVAMADRRQVRLLTKLEDGKIAAREPTEDPSKLGVPGVLMSEMFGLKSLMAPAVQKDVDEKHQLVALGEDRSPEQSAELAEVNARLSEVDVSAALPDPLYAEFVKRVMEREAALFASGANLSEEQLKDRDVLMDRVLDELFGDPE
jgi:ABC-type cobalamin/Fe3+-siderophores transport system ATPase subunit